jgi:Mg2+-importing ATPase
MVVFGLISSVFDLMTFAVLLLVFHADQATFQTSWFVVSLLPGDLHHTTKFSTHPCALVSAPHIRC